MNLKNMKNQLRMEKEKKLKALKAIFENKSSNLKIIIKSAKNPLQDHLATNDMQIEPNLHIADENQSSCLSINYSTPKNCVLIPLCSDLYLNKALENLFLAYQDKFHPEESQDAPKFILENGCALLSAKKFNQNLGFYPAERDLLSILDTTKIADVLLFVVSAVEEVDSFGEQMMTCIKSQGVPASIVILVQVFYLLGIYFTNIYIAFGYSSSQETNGCEKIITLLHESSFCWRVKVVFYG